MNPLIRKRNRMLKAPVIALLASLGMMHLADKLSSDPMLIAFTIIFLLSGIMMIPAIAYAVVLTKRARKEYPQPKLPENPKDFVTAEAEFYQAMRSMDLESERPYAVGETRSTNHFGHLEVFNGEKWVPAPEFAPIDGDYSCVKTKHGFCWTLPVDIDHCVIDAFFDLEGIFLDYNVTVSGISYRLTNQDEIMLRGLMGLAEEDDRLLHVVLNESDTDCPELNELLRRIATATPNSYLEVLAEIDEGLYLSRVCFDHRQGRPVLQIWKRSAPDCGDMELVTSKRQKLNDALEILVRKNDFFAEAMKLGYLCGKDVSSIVEPYAMRKRLENLRALFSRAREANESVRHDVSTHLCRWTIRLEESRTAFWSVFFDDASGEVMKYSLDIETASDRHYEFGHESEKALRRKLNVPVESVVPTHEILIRYLKENSRQSLESLAKGVCDRQFHYH